MGVLARVLEEAGLATVGISLVRPQAVTTRAPRFLHVDFPLGRPLGRPGDPDFQRDVIRRALALLPRTDVPVLVDHPETIDDEADEPAACPLPLRHDPTLHPAIDEALALRPAYRRHVDGADGRTAFGRVASLDTLADVIAAFVELSAGRSLESIGWDAATARAAAQDVRAYYEEAGLALAGHVPAARRLETWFFHHTEAGAVVREAAAALRRAGADRSTWYYLLPGNQH